MLGDYRSNGLAQVGSFYGSVSVSAFSLMVLVGRHRPLHPQHHSQAHPQRRMRRWVQWYVFFLAMQGLAYACWPWIFAACTPYIEVQYGCLHMVARLGYGLATVFLMRITLVRLSLIGANRARRRGSVLSTGFVASGLAAIVLYILFWSHGGCLSSCMVGFPPEASLWVACAGAVACVLVMYTAFQLNALVALRMAVRDASEEAEQGFGAPDAVRSASTVAHLLALSASSTVIWLVCVFLDMIFVQPWTQWMYELTAALDLVSDAALALVCAGYLGPTEGDSQIFKELSDVLKERRHREILKRLRDAAGASSGPACTLAALFEGVDEETLLTTAISRFRCISWDVLRAHPELVIGAEALDGSHPKTNLYDLSEPCEIAHCDAFWSHSWHDNGEQKWAALQAWCETFVQVNGRPPVLWFDKVCIDQTDIQRDLQCLPIFLAGCNNLLITCGETYTRRLWCCVELFVYMNMRAGDESRGNPLVLLLGQDDEERAQVVAGWLNFDITQCDCFQASDKDRILGVIDHYAGGATAFNKAIRDFATDVVQSGGLVAKRRPFRSPRRRAGWQGSRGLDSSFDAGGTASAMYSLGSHSASFSLCGSSGLASQSVDWQTEAPTDSGSDIRIAITV